MTTPKRTDILQSVWAMTRTDRPELDATITLEQWHRKHDDVDEPWIVVPHQPQLHAA
jgi:hypothetical protein